MPRKVQIDRTRYQSIIDYGTRNQFIPSRLPLIDICDGNTTQAFVLSYLICWAESSLSTAKPWQRGELAVVDGKEPKLHTGLWFFRTLKQIASDMGGMFSDRTIGNALNDLAEKGFVKKRRNPRDRRDKTYQYLVEINVVQARINALPYDEEEDEDFLLAQSEDEDSAITAINSTVDAENLHHVKTKKQRSITSESVLESKEENKRLSFSANAEEKENFPSDSGYGQHSSPQILPSSRKGNDDAKRKIDSSLGNNPTSDLFRVYCELRGEDCENPRGRGKKLANIKRLGSMTKQEFLSLYVFTEIGFASMRENPYYSGSTGNPEISHLIDKHATWEAACRHGMFRCTLETVGEYFAGIEAWDGNKQLYLIVGAKDEYCSDEPVPAWIAATEETDDADDWADISSSSLQNPTEDDTAIEDKEAEAERIRAEEEENERLYIEAEAMVKRDNEGEMPADLAVISPSPVSKKQDIRQEVGNVTRKRDEIISLAYCAAIKGEPKFRSDTALAAHNAALAELAAKDATDEEIADIYALLYKPRWQAARNERLPNGQRKTQPDTLPSLRNIADALGRHRADNARKEARKPAMPPSGHEAIPERENERAATSSPSSRQQNRHARLEDYTLDWAADG